jgi:hypothetical protein
MLLAGSSCAAFAQIDTTSRGTMNGDSSMMNTTNSTNSNTTTNGTNMNNTSNGTWNNNMNTTSMGDSSMLSSTGTYNAYSTYTATLPTYMESYVTRDYPAASSVRWQQVGDWYHGYYVESGMPRHIYYNGAGQTFTVALPIRSSWVPDEVVSRAVELYGPVMYDIRSVRGTGEGDVYLVRILENGQLSNQYMGADGSRVIDIYRVETADPALSNQMNASGTLSTDMNSTNATTTTDMNSTTTSDMNTNSGQSGELKIKTKTPDGKKTKTEIENGKMKIKRKG